MLVGRLARLGCARIGSPGIFECRPRNAVLRNGVSVRLTSGNAHVIWRVEQSNGGCSTRQEDIMTASTDGSTGRQPSRTACVPTSAFTLAWPAGSVSTARIAAPPLAVGSGTPGGRRRRQLGAVALGGAPSDFDEGEVRTGAASGQAASDAGTVSANDHDGLGATPVRARCPREGRCGPWLEGSRRSTFAAAWRHRGVPSAVLRRNRPLRVVRQTHQRRSWRWCRATTAHDHEHRANHAAANNLVSGRKHLVSIAPRQVFDCRAVDGNGTS